MRSRCSSLLTGRRNTIKRISDPANQEKEMWK